jgi:hypothetical protein
MLKEETVFYDTLHAILHKHNEGSALSPSRIHLEHTRALNHL